MNCNGGNTVIISIEWKSSMDLDFLCTSLIIGGFHVLGTVNNVYDMEIWYQFYYVFFFQFSFLFTDGRGLRHKYFKDYKDYLGK